MDEFFKKDKAEKNETLEKDRELYAKWKKYNLSINKPFFLIHTDFESLYLKDISGGALKLYVYLGFKAKYITGELWESIPSIANYFDKDQRTIANWFEELVNLGLVKRYQTGFKRKANTFLQPYGFVFTFKMENKNEIIESLNSTYKSKLNSSNFIAFNFNFTEYTLILINDNQLKECIVYQNLDFADIKEIKNHLKWFKLSVDLFDIDNSVINSANKEYIVYKNLLEYYKNEIL